MHRFHEVTGIGALCRLGRSAPSRPTTIAILVGQAVRQATHLAENNGTSVSRELISKVTDKVVEELLS